MTLKKLYTLIFLISFTAAAFAQDAATGIKLIKNEKYPAAIQHFSSMTGNKAQSNFYLGQIYFLQGKLDSAKLFYNEGIKADPDNDYPLNYAGLAKVAAAEGNTAEYEKNYNQVMDIDESNSEAFVVLSEGFTTGKGKNLDKAIELLNEALKVSAKKNKNKANNVQAHISLGKVYLQKGNGTEAVKSFQQALTIEPANPEALTQKAKVYILITNYNDAISLLNEAIAADPTYSPAYYELAELSATQKDYAKAAEYYAKYMENSDVDMDKQKRYASILYLNKEYQKAIDLLKQVVQNDKSASSMRILAYSHMKMEDSLNSKEYFGQLFALPNAEFQDADYENYADVLMKTGNDSLAVVYLTQLVDRDSTRKDVLGQISMVYFKQKNWPMVITTLNRKGELTAQEIFDLGKSYTFVKDSVMADTTFGRLIAAKPNLNIGYLWKARARAQFDPETEQGLAKPYYEKYVELSQADSVKYKKELIEAYSYLGYYYYLKEDWTNADIYWQKVALLDPENIQQKNYFDNRKKLGKS